MFGEPSRAEPEDLDRIVRPSRMTVMLAAGLARASASNTAPVAGRAGNDSTIVLVAALVEVVLVVDVVLVVELVEVELVVDVLVLLVDELGDVVATPMLVVAAVASTAVVVESLQPAINPARPTATHTVTNEAATVRTAVRGGRQRTVATVSGRGVAKASLASHHDDLGAERRP